MIMNIFSNIYWDLFFWYYMDFYPILKKIFIRYNLNKKLSIKQRRKIILHIPKDTFYCYNWIDTSSGKIKSCPFYKHKNSIMGICKLNNSLIDDQCKICGINKGIHSFRIKHNLI